MSIKLDGKPFTGVSYNQGAFSGNKGHIFINGQVKCSYSLNLSAKNRIWEKIQTIENFLSLIETGSICKVCAEQTKNLIKEVK
jgi:hypothetical protein